MAWTDLTFAFGSLLTATKMTQLDDNLDALMAKAAGAPQLANSYVVTAMLGSTSVISAKLGNIDASITQARLKTSMGSINSSTVDLTYQILPGGEYGFFPQTKMTDTDVDNYFVGIAGNASSTFAGWNTYATKATLRAGSAINLIYVQQRYVTASGEIHWIFILRDKITKKIGSMWQAPDHPCFGNGGKPSLAPHPFGDYDETKYEIIVINPSFEEIEQMELKTVVDDETKPDKDLLEVITENYEIDESSNPKWPDIPVTVGLPKYVIDQKTKKKILADYRFMNKDTIIEPIKKKILQPDYILCKSLNRR